MRSIYLVACLAAALATTPPVLAGPPGSGWQCGAYGWHLDGDAARDSQWVTAALKLAADNPVFRQQLHKLPAAVHFLRHATLHSVTVTADDEGHRSGIADVETDPAAVVAALRSIPGYHQTEHEGLPLHRVSQKCLERYLLPDSRPPAKPEPPLEVVDSAGQADVDWLYFAVTDEHIAVGDQPQAPAQQLDAARASRSAAVAAAPGPVFQLFDNLPPEKQMPQVSSVQVGGRQQVEIHCQLQCETPGEASSLAAICQPAALLGLIRSLAPKPRRQPPVEDLAAAKRSPQAPQPATGNDEEKTVTISVAAKFQDLDIDRDREQVLAFIGQALRVQQAGKRIDLSWNSGAELQFECLVQGRFQQHAFTALLRPAEEIRVAGKPGRQK